MPTTSNNWGPMDVWCPLIPYDDLPKIQCTEEELTRVNGAYDDWRATMRGKSVIGADTGVILDRVRMIMIQIGIACGQNRILATDIQSILSKKIREESMILVGDIPDERVDGSEARLVMFNFFQRLPLTRDIIPIEEMQKAADSVDVNEDVEQDESIADRLLGRFKKENKDEQPRKQIDDKSIKIALQESTNILKRIYMRLLSPSPWE